MVMDTYSDAHINQKNEIFNNDWLVRVVAASVKTMIYFWIAHTQSVV